MIAVATVEAPYQTFWCILFDISRDEALLQR